MSYIPPNPNGSATSANSSPVVIASDQSTIPVSNANGATSANQTNGTQQTKITDGTNVPNVLKSDGTVAGENAQLVAPAVRQLTFSTSTPGAQTILANTDVSHYTWMEIVYSSVGSGLALTGQFSTASGGTYISSSSFSSSPSTTAVNALGVTASTIYTSSIRGNFFQIAVSALTSGTFSGTITLRATPPAREIVHVGGTVAATQSATWSVGSSSATNSAPPANAFYMGIQNVSAATLVGATSFNVADGATGNAILAVGLDVWNGTTADKLRNNTTGVIIAAGATSTNAGVSTTTYNASKAVILINVSAYTSGSLTVTVNGVSSTGYTYPILTSTAISAAGVTPLRIFPGSTPSANAVANDMVPRTLQVVVTGTFVATYGIDYELSV